MTSYEDDIIKQISKYYEGACGDYIVSIAYKYDWEKTYYKTIEVFSYDDDQIIWFNDWNEGQQNVLVDGVVPLSHAYRDYWIVYDIKRIFELRAIK